MKHLILILAIILVAATYTDTNTADFILGTPTNTNVSGNDIRLNLSAGLYVPSGDFISQIFDLGSNPTATLSWTPTTPAGTTILVTSRAGNTTPVDGTWTSWSSAYATSAGSLLNAQPSRYLQYRLQYSTSDTSATPVVSSVSIIYTENGPSIADANTVNLTEETTGTYRYRISIADTVSLTNTSARYRIGTNATYSAWIALSNDVTSYYLDIPEPGAGWSSELSNTLQVNVYAENNNADTATTTLSTTIANVNEAPVLTSLSNISGTEGTVIALSVSGTDPDGDNVTFATTHGTITKVSNSLAQLTWTPDDDDVGLTNVTITMSDASLNDTETFTANITGTNKAPVITAITSQSGYYGDRISFNITVTELDTADNLTWTVTPSLFRINEQTSNSTTRIGEVAFYALDDHRGNKTYNISVEDEAGLSDSTLVNITIDYCGDNVCQSQENTTSCTRDCGTQETQISYLVIQTPDRICINETNQLTSYNASARYSCFVDGQTENYNAVCNEIGNVGLEIFRLQGELRSSPQTLSTDTAGIGQWTPPQVGEYKIVATEEGFVSTSRFVTAQACTERVELGEEIITLQKPIIPVPETRNTQTPPPELERPQGEPQKTSVISAIIFYVFIPLFLAILIYTCSAYYDVNKDADPIILKARVKYWELHHAVAPIMTKVYAPFKPYLDPVVVLWKEHVIEPFVELFKSKNKKKK